MERRQASDREFTNQNPFVAVRKLKRSPVETRRPEIDPNQTLVDDADIFPSNITQNEISNPMRRHSMYTRAMTGNTPDPIDHFMHSKYSKR